jgi:hypothetical protein
MTRVRPLVRVLMAFVLMLVRRPARLRCGWSIVVGWPKGTGVAKGDGGVAKGDGGWPKGTGVFSVLHAASPLSAFNTA